MTPDTAEASAWQAAPLPATRLHARPSPDHAARVAEAQACLQQAAQAFTTGQGRVEVTQANSLGAEDVVVAHLIAQLGLPIPSFVLDTGVLHPETLSLLKQTIQANHAPVVVFTPKSADVDAFVAREGSDAMYRSLALRKACCQVRKLEPLERALAGHRAWITGLRREQSSARADVPLVDTSETATGGRTKFNPLANWTWGDVWHFIAEHGVPYNALHDRFFPSIGCAPCTRAISLGEDFRAGRWWWEQESAKECGLHVKTDTPHGAAA